MAGGDFEIDGRTIIESIVGALTAILGWLWVRNDATSRDHSRRLSHLEASTVTREELEETIDKQYAALRTDRMAMHAENKEQFKEAKEQLARIEGKMDVNDRATQGIAIQVAVLQAKGSDVVKA